MPQKDNRLIEKTISETLSRSVFSKAKKPRRKAMPNLAQTLKQEIARIAKREIKPLVAKQAKIIAVLRDNVAILKRGIAEQERSRKANTKLISQVGTDSSSTDVQPKSSMWFTAKGVRSIRKRLGLSQVQFAKLLCMSPQAVIRWESSNGELNLRPQALKSLIAARGMGKQEAAEKMGAIKANDSKSKKATKTTARKKK